MRHVVERARLNFDILDQLDFVNRTSELARVFGIDFFSVLNRGSQVRPHLSGGIFERREGLCPLLVFRFGCQGVVPQRRH